MAAIGDAIERRLEAERDQLALWLPVALGLGIALWFALPDRAAWSALILAMLALALAACAARRHGRAARAVGWFALIVAVGCALAWLHGVRPAGVTLVRPVVVRFSARIEQVEPLAARDAVRLLLAPQGAPTLPARLRVTLPAERASPALAPGGVIAVRARLLPPPPPEVPGAYDFRRTAWFQRIGATGTVLGQPTLLRAAPATGIGARFDAWRSALAAHIGRQLPGGTGGIATALATGEEGAIPKDDADAMRNAGLAHLLAVSGLHLGAVVGAVMLLTLRLLALSPRLALRLPLPLIAALVAAAAGIAYTLLTGAHVPTVRACVAALLVLGGIALGREALTLRLVAAGALVVLLLWPESLTGASFQMSFAAIIAIVALHEHPRIGRLLAPRAEGRGAALLRGAATLLLTGLAVELTLAPIALYHFHRAGLYGALANIVAIPLTTFVIMPAEGLALLLDLFGLGAPLWWLAGKALALLLLVAHRVAAIPGAVATLPTLPAGAFAAMVIGGLWIALWRTRLRWAGALLIAAGAIWALAAPAADILVTGDGRHVALRLEDGHIALLRERTGDYVRSTLAEVSGRSADATIDIATLPFARCSRDACIADLVRDGRRWRLLATRSAYLFDIAALERACATSDIVVSDRRLPRACRPRWIKADARLLARSGGLAINLGSGRIDSVAEADGAHPWAAAPPDR